MVEVGVCVATTGITGLVASPVVSEVKLKPNKSAFACWIIYARREKVARVMYMGPAVWITPYGDAQR